MVLLLVLLVREYFDGKEMVQEGNTA